MDVGTFTGADPGLKTEDILKDIEKIDCVKEMKSPIIDDIIAQSRKIPQLKNISKMATDLSIPHSKVVEELKKGNKISKALEKHKSDLGSIKDTINNFSGYLEQTKTFLEDAKAIDSDSEAYLKKHLKDEAEDTEEELKDHQIHFDFSTLNTNIKYNRTKLSDIVEQLGKEIVSAKENNRAVQAWIKEDIDILSTLFTELGTSIESLIEEAQRQRDSITT